MAIFGCRFCTESMCFASKGGANLVRVVSCSAAKGKGLRDSPRKENPRMTKNRYMSYRRTIKILQGLIVTFGLLLLVLEKLLQILGTF